MKISNPLANPLKKYKKLNFGCGWDKRDGYLNVDVDPAVEPDLLIKNSDYTVIPMDHFEEILANDVLEHIPRPECLSVLLDWSRYLKMGKKIHIQTSSILGVAKQLEKSKSFADQFGWTICLFGNQAHEGDFHHVGFTELTLRVHLMAAGFEIDSFALKDKWLFHIDARKVSDWTKTIDECKRKDDGYFVRAAFRAAFDREPDEHGGIHIRDALRSKDMTRLQALKHLYKSPERLYHTAELNNCL